MATFSQSTVAKGSDSVTDFCCSSCLEHKIDQWAEFYCDNCLKFYCAKCINLHGQLFGKHVTYGRGDISKWPVSKEVEDFLQKCDLHEDKRLEMFCDDHLQLCCTNCAFLNHRLCAKVTLISESVKGPPIDLQQLSRKIQTILETLKKLENNWNTNMQTLQASYNKQLHEICDCRQKINTILDTIEKTTRKELHDKLTSLEASVKTDVDNCSKLKNELKKLSDAVHDIVDKGKAELTFIASKKCLEKIYQSETYMNENSDQLKRSLTFQADHDFQQYLSKLSGLGRIELSTKGQSQASSSKNSEGSTCMEVLKYEKQQLDKQVASLRESLSATQLAALTGKSKLLQQKLDMQAAKLKEGGVPAWKDYVKLVDGEISSYEEEARQYAKQGDMQKAQLMLTKKKLADKEVSAIRAKIPNI